MVEVVRAPRRRSLSFVDRKVLTDVAGYGVPVLMAIVFLFSLTLSIQRAGFLRDWSESYGQTSSYLVVGCGPIERFSGDQWACDGRLDQGVSREGPSTLITSREARASSRPYVGERLDVFFAADSSATVYPLQYRLNELTRLYLSLLPRLLVMFGSIIWLAGWALTRNLDPADFVTRDSMRLPQRFSWRSRGITWIISGLGFFVVNHYLTTRVLGSLNIL